MYLFLFHIFIFTSGKNHVRGICDSNHSDVGHYSHVCTGQPLGGLVCPDGPGTQTAIQPSSSCIGCDRPPRLLDSDARRPLTAAGW